MSLTPLEGSKKPFKCGVCGTVIQHDEIVNVILIDCTIVHAPFHEDGPWIVDMDYTDTKIVCTVCKG